MTSFNHHQTHASLRIRCIAHIPNQAVKDCMGLIHDKLDKIRRLLALIQRSGKRQDLFDDIKDEMCIKCELLGFNMETRWSLVLTTILKNLWLVPF